VIWDFDTAQDFKTTNGVHAHGGSLNGAGPAILNSMLFVNTGYTNAMAGNVLLAFALDLAQSRKTNVGPDKNRAPKQRRAPLTQLRAKTSIPTF
jgi:hypothetical protein